MQVFNAFMKIVLKRISVPIIYIGIFLGISIIMANQGAENEAKFKQEKLTISVTDLDNSAASERLIEYLSENHKIIDEKYDDDKLLSNLYYEHLDYALTINEGYMEKLENGSTDNLFTNHSIEGSYGESLAGTQINRYVSCVSSYIKGGFTIDEALDKTHALMLDKTEVIAESFAKEENFFSTNIRFYFQYLPYIFLAILISALVPTLLVLNKKEIRDRTNASCISISKQTFQTTLGSVIYAIGIWLVFMISFIVMCGSDIFTKEGLLAMLNSFVFLIVALSITMLIAQISKSPKSPDMIANTLSLGMSFLCGIFVPIEYLSDTVIKIAHFLPAYWYVRANNMLAEAGGETFTNSGFFMCIGIELLFAAALFSLVFLTARIKRKSA
ncbi:MAG: ABC transporter permease [Ruminococcus sp.]|nr:ABC transporter permease [Ruminococcus sp.]